MERRQWLPFPPLEFQSVPALDNDKHVVDANAEEEERQDRVHRPEEQTDCRAGTVASNYTHHHTANAS